MKKKPRSVQKMTGTLHPECYVVRGVDSRGQFWLSRKFVTPYEFPTLEAARDQAAADVERMNSLGAEVRMFRQELDADCMTWRDVDEPEATSTTEEE